MLHLQECYLTRLVEHAGGGGPWENSFQVDTPTAQSSPQSQCKLTEVTKSCHDSSLAGARAYRLAS